MVEWKKLSDICGIYDGTHQTPNYTDNGVKFVSVENINAPYESKKYISEEEYERNYKTKPQIGDVLMTRIGDVGTCCVLNNDEPIAYYVSLALLRPNNQIVQSNYIKYILESNTGKRELRKKTLLTAVPLKINLGDVGKIIIPIPPISEQERIVGILDTFTSSIENLKQQIAQRRKQYEYYRDLLLDLEGKEGVEMKMLGDISKVLRGKRLTKKLLDDKGAYPVFHGGLEPLGRYGQFNRDANTVMVINVGASAGSVGFSNCRFWSSDGCFCISHSELLNNKFLFYYLQTKTHYLQSQVRHAGIPTLDNPVVEKMKIPTLPLSEQQRIVDILDKFEAIIQNLEAQLSQREKQYEYYRNKLLTFE